MVHCVQDREWCNGDVESRETCEACRKARRQAITRAGLTAPFYVVAYCIDRVFGGREEGGWWYDWQSVLETRQVYTVTEALAAMRELRARYPQPRNNRFSAAGSADYFVELRYDRASLPEQDTERPYYC